MSPSFPATGVVIVDVSRYAVTTQNSLLIPPRSPAIVGSAVDTIVESSDAISITSISAANTGPTRADLAAGDATAWALAVTAGLWQSAAAEERDRDRRQHDRADLRDDQ